MGHQAAVRKARALSKQKRVPYRVGLRLELVFSEQETRALQEFQNAVNSAGEALSLEHLCRQSIFLTITESWKRAQALQEQITAEAKLKAEMEANGKSESGDIARDSETTLVSESSAPDSLAEAPVGDAEATPAG